MFNTSRNKSSSLVLKPCKSVQESSEEVLFIKARQIARQMYLSRFNMWFSTALDKSCIYWELQNSDFHICFSHISKLYLCRVYFLTTLYIYKDYFKSRLRWCNLMQSDYSLKLWPETICPSTSFSWRSCCVCAPRVL